MLDMLGYKDKTVVITGAASGMGAAAAELLLQLGAEVHTLNIAPVIAEFEDSRRGRFGWLQRALHSTSALVPLIVLVAALVLFGVLLGSKFFSPFALTLILQQVQIVGVLAAAQTLIILTAGIDLSVGAIAVFCTVIMGRLSFHGITIFLPAFGDGQFYFYPWVIPPAPAGLAVLIGLMVGTLLGAISG